MDTLIEFLRPLAKEDMLSSVATFSAAVLALVSVFANYYIQSKLLDRRLNSDVELKDKELKGELELVKNTELKQKIEQLLDSASLYELSLIQEMQNFDFFISKIKKEPQANEKDEHKKARTLFDEDINQITKFTIATKVNLAQHIAKASTLANLYAMEVSELLESISAHESSIIEELHDLRFRLRTVYSKEKEGLFGTSIEARIDISNTHETIQAIQEEISDDLKSIRMTLAAKVKELN